MALEKISSDRSCAEFGCCLHVVGTTLIEARHLVHWRCCYCNEEQAFSHGQYLPKGG